MSKKEFDTKKLAQEILKEIGGKENISHMTCCMSRLRFRLKDNTIPDRDKVKSMNGVAGLAESGGQFQVIVGNKARTVYTEMVEMVGDTAVAGENGRKLNPVVALMGTISDIFTPILSVLVACGILLGITNMTEGKEGDFSEIAVLPAPMYVSSLQGYETFTGRIRYRFSVYLENEQTVVPARIVLDGVREGASVRVNGIYCGTKIVPDYHYQVLGLKPGENVIEVELNTTLGRTINDYLSQYLPMEPTGLSGARLELASQRNV